MSKKLFRMTDNRQRLMTKICSAVTIKRESYGTAEVQGVEGSVRSIGRHLYKDKDELLEHYSMCDQEEKRWGLVFDVLWITMNHNDISLINMHCNGGSSRFKSEDGVMSDEQYKLFVSKDERGWYNEWDIPLSVYNKAIDDALEWLTELDRNTPYQRKKEIALLHELKKHRNGD